MQRPTATGVFGGNERDAEAVEGTAVARLMWGAIAGCTQPSSTSIFLAWRGAGQAVAICRAGIERFMNPGINGRTNWPRRSNGVKRAG